jgi:hypothetical protein
MTYTDVNISSDLITYNDLLKLAPNPNENFFCKLRLPNNSTYVMRYLPGDKEITIYKEGLTSYRWVLTEDNYVTAVPKYVGGKHEINEKSLRNVLDNLFSSSLLLSTRLAYANEKIKFGVQVGTPYYTVLSAKEKDNSDACYYAPYSVSYSQPIYFINPNTKEGQLAWRNQDNNLSIMIPPTLYRNLDLNFVRELYKEVFLMQQVIKTRSLLFFSPTFSCPESGKIHHDKHVGCTILTLENEGLRKLKKDVVFYVSEKLEEYRIECSEYMFIENSLGYGYGRDACKVPAIVLSINTMYSDIELLTKLHSTFC